jgi:ribosome-associated translation inhibitor RaiA
MQVQLDISHQGVGAPAAVVANIRRRAAKLDRFADEIGACHAAIGAAPRSGHKGEVYTVWVQLRWRHAAAADGSAPHAERSHADMLVAIHHVFDDVLDQLRLREADRRYGSRRTEGGHEAPEKFNV